ncbi:MAG TPA: flagellar basal body-associated FliL family protein [Bacteroidota bacterium]|nr:flagellar basal body-associated FliL family protein [Bacteroidota bacterium]
MAKEIVPTDQSKQPPPAASPAPPQGVSPVKLIMIGIPVFLVQLAVVYFLVAKFVSPGSSAQQSEAAKTEQKESADQSKSIFVVKDVIVNPAGTNGTRFLLTTVGFEISGPEREKDLEKREVQVRDVLNSVLTSKGLDELVRVDQREMLRKEIAQKVGEMLPSGALTNVYFSKFIIQ